jgi:serine/threonine protein kinase
MGSVDYSFDPGAVFPGTRYRVDHPLGHGGMGRVYAATHLDTGERRAVKLLSRQLVGLPFAEARLLREAELLTALRGPHIVGLHEVGELDDGRPFLVLDLLEGETLRAALGPGPFPPPVACGLGAQILTALAAVHAAGIVHRDVKPENLFWRASDGVCVLLDFGLAKVLTDEGRFTPLGFETVKGTALGTARYLPPEAGRDDPDAGAHPYASDLYAAGVVLAELLGGRLPWAQLDNRAWLDRVAERGFPKPRNLPAALRPVIACATATQPGDRYGSAAEFAAHLGWVCRSAGIDLPDARPLPSPAPVSSSRWLVSRTRLARTLFVGLSSGATTALLASSWAGQSAALERLSPETRSAPRAAAAPAPSPSPPKPAAAAPAKASAPTQAPGASASAGKGSERRALEARVQSGRASESEALRLVTLCREVGDEACVDRARAFAAERKGEP